MRALILMLFLVEARAFLFTAAPQDRAFQTRTRTRTRTHKVADTMGSGMLDIACVAPNMSFVRADERSGRVAYLDTQENVVCCLGGESPGETVSRYASPSSYVADIDLYGTRMLVAHPRDGYFRASVRDIREEEEMGGWALLPTVHRFPILRSFLYNETIVLSVATNGVFSVTDVSSGKVSYLDASTPATHARLRGDELIIMGLQDVIIYNVREERFTDCFSPEMTSIVSSFCLRHDHEPPGVMSMLVCGMDGSVLSVVFDREAGVVHTDMWWKFPYGYVRDCFLEGTRYVLAGSDGSLRQGTLEAPSKALERRNVFHPRHFKRMSASSGRLYLDATVRGIEQ